MHVIRARNVNWALSDALWWLRVNGEYAASRNGTVLRATTPVCTVYERPTERVLFSPQRDANPFFHYLESMWMLAGRNDVSFPATYAKQLLEYTDNGDTFNGAYGFRWRRHFKYDQLKLIVDTLHKTPNTRRCVLSMWDGGIVNEDFVCQSDMHKALYGSKDVPCNTTAYFIVRDGALDLTVCNRSNDIVWGAYGANAVHFSVLLEYVAVGAGLFVGKYYQISNDFHMYVDRKDCQRLYDGIDVKLRSPEDTDQYTALQSIALDPLFSDIEAFDRELNLFFAQWDAGHFNEDKNIVRAIEKNQEVAVYGITIPMVWSYRLYKEKQVEKAIYVANKYIVPVDWRYACVAWLERRKGKQ